MWGAVRNKARCVTHRATVQGGLSCPETCIIWLWAGRLDGRILSMGHLCRHVDEGPFDGHGLPFGCTGSGTLARGWRGL